MSAVPGSFAAARLRRIAHQPRAEPRGEADPAPRECCDLCAEPLPPRHRHMLDVLSGEIACACQACALLFDKQAAGGGHYRLLPDRRLRLEDFAIDDLMWATLGVPVDLAFFVREGASGEVTVGYPSPLGTMRSTVDPQTWRELRAASPALAAMADDVEALLVNRAKGAREHWLVPLDDCYRLVAVVREHWKGLGGGLEVWQHVARFFEELSTGS